MTESPVLLSPSALELLDLVAAFIEKDLMPAQTDARLRFRARVAADLLRSAAREVTTRAQLQSDSDGYAIPAAMSERGDTLRGVIDDLRNDRRVLLEESVYEAALELVRAKLAVVTDGERNATS